MTKLPQIKSKETYSGSIRTFFVLESLIVMALFLLTSLSCVDTPEIRILEINNKPPLITKSKIKPDTPIVRIDSLCKKEFAFSEVIEIDTEDMLYVRWYIDYEQIKNYQKSSVIPPPTKKDIVRAGDSFTLDLRNSILPSKSRGSLHTVEVIISDRPFLLDSTEPPPFKAIEKGGNFDYLSWTVIQLEDCY